MLIATHWQYCQISKYNERGDHLIKDGKTKILKVKLLWCIRTDNIKIDKKLMKDSNKP